MGDCDAEFTGPEFNPLTEKDKYGNLNPFQDPARGRITLPAANGEGDFVLDGTQTLLQNLAGP